MLFFWSIWPVFSFNLAYCRPNSVKYVKLHNLSNTWQLLLIHPVRRFCRRGQFLPLFEASHTSLVFFILWRRFFYFLLRPRQCLSSHFSKSLSGHVIWTRLMMADSWILMMLQLMLLFWLLKPHIHRTFRSTGSTLMTTVICTIQIGMVWGWPRRL